MMPTFEHEKYALVLIGKHLKLSSLWIVFSPEDLNIPQVIMCVA
jgi:hypothetical protein